MAQAIAAALHELAANAAKVATRYRHFLLPGPLKSKLLPCRNCDRYVAPVSIF